MKIIERIRRKFYPFELGATGPDPEDPRDYKISKISQPALLDELPQTFEIQSSLQLKQQWGRGSCTSQACSGSHEADEGMPLSARFVMACAKHIEKNTSYGAYTRNAMKAMNQYGSISETYYPEPGPEMSWNEYIKFETISINQLKDGKTHAIGSYWRVGTTADRLKLALYQFNKDLPVGKQKPLVISMNWFKSFKPDENGVLPAPKDSVGGHAVRIRGWTTIGDKECWILENSWGKWGTERTLLNDKLVYSIGYLPFSYKECIWDAWLSLDLKDVPKSGLRLVTVKGKPAVYVTVEQTMERRPILSGEDYISLVGENWDLVQEISQEELDTYSEGSRLIILNR